MIKELIGREFDWFALDKKKEILVYFRLQDMAKFRLKSKNLYKEHDLSFEAVDKIKVINCP
jgi:hypothetical protein